MKRNIDILKEIQKNIHSFRVMSENIDITVSDEDTELADMINDGREEITDIIAVIGGIAEQLAVLTEDVRNAMCNDGFDCDDYDMWNNYISDNPYELEGRLESVEEALEILDFFILESLKGYKMLTQFAYSPETANLPRNREAGDT